MSELADGLYEQLVTLELRAKLSRLDANSRQSIIDKLGEADSAAQIALHVAAEMRRLLPHLHSDSGGLVERQLELCNQILAMLREAARGGDAEFDLASPPSRLLAVSRTGQQLDRPVTPLAQSALLTGAKDEPRLGNEIVAELASCDGVDILVSFIKWQGVRKLQVSLESMARDGKRVRLLTTTYMGATEVNALDWLARLPNVEVRVSHDHRRTRLHAKAWLFRRNTGFHTAYVGSANVSASALDLGVEWTLKACQADAPHIIDRFRAAFNTLWEDSEFERYDPDSTECRERLMAALAESRGGGGAGETGATFALRLEPYPFQQQILDELQAERQLRGHMRNLVVSATGTGKTMVAAFDYQRQIKADGLRPRLLFIAHREELLIQAMNAFRHVLRDGAFGELLKGGSEPTRHDHLFATIQSVNSRRLVESCGSNFWDFVVVDEFHHAAAATYDRLLEDIKPRVLLGLTATPERADGQSVLHWFDDRIASEIRLWDALERQLLTPFEYYGIHDNTDLRSLRWQRGGYDLNQLENIYTGNDLRTVIVLEQFNRLHGNPRAARALGFCVSVRHAEYMAKKFSEAGIPSIAVHGKSSEEERGSAIRRLQERAVNVIFTCDLYNEGVDIPEADCLLMLRPTESPTIFLQQLGRGLRLSSGKHSTLVLDFIGQMHARYRVDLKLRALTGEPRAKLLEAVERGFPLLPSGCHMQLDRVAREMILENLKQVVRPRKTQLAQELAALAREHGGKVTLERFLELTGSELSDLYRSSIGGWTALRREAGLAPDGSGEPFGARLERVLHLDDPDRLQLYIDLIEGQRDVAETSDLEKRQLLMLGYRLAKSSEKASVKAAWVLEQLALDVESAREAGQLCRYLLERVPLAPVSSTTPHGWPLNLHRRYMRDEILAATGQLAPDYERPSREGRLWLPDFNTELLFVTLNKSEERFSPTTRYLDYAISDRLFHWQSQSTTGEDSPTGRRYREQSQNGTTFLLFVRENPNDAFSYLGPLKFVSHEGSRPMSITWQLQRPMPAMFLRRYACLATA